MTILFLSIIVKLNGGVQLAEKELKKNYFEILKSSIIDKKNKYGSMIRIDIVFLKQEIKTGR